MFSMQTPQTPWFAATIGLVGLVVGYSIATGFNGILPAGGLPDPAIVDDQPAAPAQVFDPAEIEDDSVLGNADAPITVIEFTDYQCPFCSRHYEQTFGSIKSDYVDSGKVKYVIRDYVLPFHPNAQKAAESAECAGDQNKYWEMHALLFAKQQEWSPSTDGPTVFKQYAADIGLNAATFASCLDDGVNAEEVKKDMADGQAAGIDGTPGFWIVGPDGQTKQISGAYPYETFKTAFDGMLE